MNGSGDWPREVYEFWFDELSPEDWFRQSDAVDTSIKERFSDLHAKLAETDTAKLSRNKTTVLSAIIVLDQFSRNMFRRTAKAFATDGKALAIAKAAIDAGLDEDMSEQERQFLYMPFMHSEDLADQDRCVALFAKLGKEEALKFAREHRDIIAKFGRYPYRNKVLGRESTPEEVSFTEGHSGYGQ